MHELEKLQGFVQIPKYLTGTDDLGVGQRHIWCGVESPRSAGDLVIPSSNIFLKLLSLQARPT